ncbi:MAG: TerB family tellurite resistance protein [Atopobiaceae bacterium]|nr:TerB family tellurite resistance protein [Atopobiaceae bacterium]
MNSKAEVALDQFIQDFDAFLVKCSEFELSGTWNVKQRGFMSAYFEADLLAVALHIMSVDGVFERAEAEVLNRMFQTNYTSRDLRNMYVSLKPVVDDYCDAEAADAVTLLSELSAELSEQYKQLILEACRIISLSDGVAEGEETELIEKLRAALEE